MKKIPTLFKRVYDGHNIVGITDELTSPDLQWVLDGEGVATIKDDGACCAIIDGKFYKRYDAKKGKKAPENAIPCQAEADPVTGHFPHWVPCDRNNPADKWFWAAYDFELEHEPIPDGTYEAVGKHFQGNPYDQSKDILIKHGTAELPLSGKRTFDDIREFLKGEPIEGIVFWKDGEPRCKIKRTDFGFDWPVNWEEW